MIKSMTGFGKASAELNDKRINIEVRALNSKQLDIFTRLPNIYRERDLEIRNELANRLKRGKIELVLTLDFKEGEQVVQLNAPVIKSYYKQLQGIMKELGSDVNEPLMPVVMRLPEVLNGTKEEIDEKEWADIVRTIQQAIDRLDLFRDQEGQALREDMLNHLDAIEGYLKQVEPFEKERLDVLKGKLTSSLQELFSPGGYDKNRLEQEMIFYLEKFDITEEKIRLKNHCSYFRAVTEEEEVVGKKLAFVAQEIGREINTLGSKASHSDIQRMVVLMKDELEKIKEQLMNVL
ncbi:MAG: YicC family protein [Bacteroidales bacterium]|nr:YicC family protein [Bacteroidales bacterium]MBN2764318.1 YicC family protein [Bacteroidales bacterium]